jgi:hypothetical protein
MFANKQIKGVSGYDSFFKENFLNFVEVVSDAIIFNLSLGA